MEPETSQSGGIIGMLAWLEVHKKRLIAVGVVALVAIFLIMMFVQHQADKEMSASRAVSDVRVPFSSAVVPPPGTVEALARAATEHSGTKAAERALLVAAGIRFSEAKSAADYAEAEKQFARVVQEYPGSIWAAQANLGVAAALAAQGKSADAITKYEEITRRFASSSIIDEARLALARLYEPQKQEEAFKLYEELLKGNPQSVLAMEANMRQDDMLKRDPKLAALKASLNPPPAPPTPPQQPPVQITPMTNRVVTAVSNAANRAATSAPVQINLTPTPSPGAANPAPPK
jgi:tetratricopeptide (TPR) repeat protein